MKYLSHFDLTFLCTASEDYDPSCIFWISERGIVVCFNFFCFNNYEMVTLKVQYRHFCAVNLQLPLIPPLEVGPLIQVWGNSV